MKTILHRVYGSTFWKAFFECFILEYCSTSGSAAVFGATCIDVGVIRVFFLDVGECLLIDSGVHVLFGEFG